MGLFSGNKTQQTTSVTNLTDASNIGLQLSDDASSVVLRGDNSSVEVIDVGAVNAAFGFAERTASAYADATTRALDLSTGLSGQFIDRAADLSNDASERVSELARENASDLRQIARDQTQSEASRITELVKLALAAGVVVMLGRYFITRKVAA
jgi:hypothetical protein